KRVFEAISIERAIGVSQEKRGLPLIGIHIELRRRGHAKSRAIKPLLTLGAESVSFAIGFRESIGKPHHAADPVAVTQPENMSELMNGFGYRALDQQTAVCGLSVRARIKTGQRKYGAELSRIGFSKNEIELGHV